MQFNVERFYLNDSLFMNFLSSSIWLNDLTKWSILDHLKSHQGDIGKGSVNIAVNLKKCQDSAQKGVLLFLFWIIDCILIMLGSL